MDGNFRIGSDLGGGFNVFDEWGNFMGKFIPAGGAGGCWGVFALIVFGIIAFLIYLLIRLIIEGFKALGRKQWGWATLYLSVPAALALGACGFFFLVTGSFAATEYNYNQSAAATATQWTGVQQAEGTRQAAMEQATQQALPILMQEARQKITASDVELLTAAEVMWNTCGSYVPCDETAFMHPTGGIHPLKGDDSVAEHFPYNQHYLVPPTSR